MRRQAELARLLVDPVYRGEDIPRSDGGPVLLIPGFLAADGSLSVTASTRSSTLQGRAAPDVHAAQAPADQADRAQRPDRPRSAVRHLVALEAGRRSGRRGVVTDISHRRAAGVAAPRGRPFSSGENVEALQRPRL